MARVQCTPFAGSDYRQYIERAVLASVWNVQQPRAEEFAGARGVSLVKLLHVAWYGGERNRPCTNWRREGWLTVRPKEKTALEVAGGSCIILVCIATSSIIIKE